MAIGADIGTYNLVVCRRDAQGNFVQKREVNAFLEIPTETKFLFNMMKTAGVPLIERKDQNMAYALGEAAVKIACDMPAAELRRPMKNGTLNPTERSAHQILGIMIHSLLNDIKMDQETLYYCVPADAINEETNAEHHSKLVASIFKAFNDEGKRVNANPINEALALIYAELGAKAWTGMGLSFGAGMVNVCYAKFGNPIFSFALVNSGDWIDKMTAMAVNMPIAYVNREKEKVDLTVENPESLVQRSIKNEYEIMLQKTVTGIKKGLDKMGNNAPMDPVDIVIAGGTASPVGFEKLFLETLNSARLPIKIGEVIKAKDPLYAVSRGCLLAAEAAEKG
jgi:actin-like ATPase involved in cell morphogenesis